MDEEEITIQKDPRRIIAYLLLALFVIAAGAGGLLISPAVGLYSLAVASLVAAYFLGAE